VPPGVTVDQLDEWIKQGTMAPQQLEILKKLRAAISPAEATDQSPEMVALLQKYADDPKMLDIIQRQGGQEAATTPRSVANLTSQKAGIDFGGPNATGMSAIDNRLRDLLGQDIDAALAKANPNEAAQLKVAQGAHKQFRDFTDSNLAAQVAANTPQNTFDKIPDALLNSKASAADLRKLMSVTTPETQDKLREVLLRKIVGNAESITPKQIERGLYTYGKVAKEILTPEQFQTLRDISIVRKGLGKTTIGSPTTPLLQAREYLKSPVRMAALLGAGAIGAREDGGVGAAAGVGGTLGAEALIAMLLGGKGGQRWLTTGLGRATLPGSLVRAGSVATSRIPSEVEIAKRRRALEESLGRR